MKKTFAVLSALALALAGIVFGFVARREVMARSFGDTVEFNPLVFDVPASSQGNALGQAGGGACKN